MKNTWLIGASQMAVDYAQVLKAQNVDFLVIGRGETSANNFYDKTGIRPITGGLDRFLSTKPEMVEAAIVAVGAEELAKVTHSLLEYGIKNILVEKPGALSRQDLAANSELADRNNANVYIAYNRRFYSSVLKARELIKEDGGVTSFHFEFTEWGPTITPMSKSIDVKANWFLANSTHVIDLAFFLGGNPINLASRVSGECEWHKPTIFTGCGETDNGTLFSYCANWFAPGRWSVEFMTARHRFIFRPLEKLQIQNIGSLTSEFVDLDDTLDKEYKPGLFAQVSSFLNGNSECLCTCKQQVEKINIYQLMQRPL